MAGHAAHEPDGQAARQELAGEGERAAAAITCLQAVTEEWMRLGGEADQFGLYDAAVQASRRPA